VGVQEKFECTRSSREVQISTSSERVFPSQGSKFGEIFSPVAKLTSIRVLMSLDYNI
jgi:hypothetical protein